MNLFKIFKKIMSLLRGRGLNKLPFAPKIYKFIYNRLKPDGVIKINAGKYNFFVDARDTGIAPYLIMRGSFDDNLTFFLKKILKPNMIFADIGANMGYFSIIASDLVGENGKVYAFEPDDHNYELLVKNIKLNNCLNIIPIKKAVSDKDGIAKLYLAGNDMDKHSLFVLGEEFKEVETVALDSFFKDENPNVIKADIEGYESYLLEGSGNIISSDAMSCFVTEYCPELIKRAGRSPINYLKALFDCNLKLYKIGNNGSLLEIDKDFNLTGEKITNIACLK